MTKGFSPKFMITNGITSGLTRIERARGFLEAAALSDAWIREMGHRAFILEAHHTTHIEGTRLTLAWVEAYPGDVFGRKRETPRRQHSACNSLDR